MTEFLCLVSSFIPSTLKIQINLPLLVSWIYAVGTVKNWDNDTVLVDWRAHPELCICFHFSITLSQLIVKSLPTNTALVKK